MSDVVTPLFKVFMPPTVTEALQDILFSGYVAEGEAVTEFTRIAAEFLGNPRTVMVNSCTTALLMAYRLAGVGPGTEVISTPLTSVATNQPVLSLGGKPVWADVDPATGLSDPEDIRSLVNERTRAIVVLHKEGDLAPLDEICAIGREHNIRIIEDAAHAFGAEYQGTKIGNHGDFVCFSFQAIKHITTGDGGAISCRNEDDYLAVKRMKWFGVDRDEPGNPWLQDVDEWGYKGNMNNIAAAIGIEQMKHAADILQKYHQNGRRFTELLDGVDGVSLLTRDPGNFETYWAYTLLVENRQALITKLAEAGVTASQIHPRNDQYSVFAESRRDLPNIDWFAARELCLPSGWWVSDEEISRICDVIKSGW